MIGVPQKAIKKFTKPSHREIVVGILLAYGLFPRTTEGIDEAKKFVDGLDQWIVPSELPDYYDEIESDLMVGKMTAKIANIRDILDEFYFRGGNAEQPEPEKESEVVLVINEVENQSDDQPIEVEVSVPSQQEPRRKRIIKGKRIKNTIKKPKPVNKTRDLVNRMARSFDKRMEELIDEIQNPPDTTPLPVNVKKPKKVGEVQKKTYRFKQFKSTSTDQADNFNEYLWGKLGSAFSLASQARKAANESGADKQEKGFFLKKALLHEFGGDRLNRGFGTLSSDPEEYKDPSLSKGQRFAAKVSPFIRPPSDTVKPRQYAGIENEETGKKEDKVPVKDTSLHSILKDGIKKIQDGYTNVDDEISKSKKKVQNKDESVLALLAESFLSLKKSIKDSNDLDKKGNQIQQKQNEVQLDFLDSLEASSKEASLEGTKDVAGVRGYKDPYAKVTGAGGAGGILGGLFSLYRKIRLARRLMRRANSRNVSRNPRRVQGRPNARPSSGRPRITTSRNAPRFRMPGTGPRVTTSGGVPAPKPTGGNWLSRLNPFVNRSVQTGIRRASDFGKNINILGKGGGLLRGVGGLAGKLLRIPVVADMLFPEGTSSYDQLSGPNAYYNAPGYKGPRPDENTKQFAEGGLVRTSKTENKTEKMASGGVASAGGVNAMIGEAGPEMWFSHPSAIPPMLSSMVGGDSAGSSVPIILGTVSKVMRDAGPVAAPVRPFIEQLISPLEKIYGKEQFNLTSKVGKNTANLSATMKEDGEDGLLGIIKKAFNFLTGNEEEGGGSETPTTPSPTGSDAGAYKELLDMIAGHESTSYGGYEAFNTGGSNNGYTAHGSGDSSKDAIDGVVKPLTQRTVAEVMRLQAAGKLHATGRYQIIQTTLASLMNGGYGETGVKPTDLYDAVTQDKLGIALIKYRLNTGANVPNFISEWRGLANENPQKLQEVISRADAAYKANPNATASAAPAAPGSPPAAPGTPPPSTSALPTRAVGDSIAQGVSDASGGRVKDHATPGHSPQDVLSNLRNAGISSSNTSQVVLSTGLSNNPSQKGAVLDQLALLQSKRIPFTVLPVSNQISNANGNLNSWLSGAVRQAGGRFASDTAFNAASGDRTRAHPESYIPMVRSLRLSRS